MKRTNVKRHTRRAKGKLTVVKQHSRRTNPRTAYDHYGVILGIGSKVKAIEDLYDYSGSDEPAINEGEILEIDGIDKSGQLTFTTIRDYLSFDSGFFKRVNKK
jgi:hypothetical protein